MAYYDAIANAIGARGNALAQGALQSGQVWGNLAANLGQIPGQAIAFHQQRQDALQNNELKKLHIEKAQRDADFEKRATAIAHDPSKSPEQKDMEMIDLFREHPDKYQTFLTLQENQRLRQQQAAVSFNTAREGKPGTVAPQGGYALPMPTRGETVPGGGVGNAFEPPVPIPEQMVHPPIPIPGRPDLPALTAQTAAQVQGRKDVTAETAGARQLKNQMALAKFKATLRPDTFATQTRPDKDPTSSTGWTLKQFNKVTGKYDIPTGLESPPPPSMMPSGQTQLTTITTAQGPKLAEYKPGKAGSQGSIRVIQEGAVKGNIPALGEATQKELTGLGTTAATLGRVNETIKNVQTGPMWGRLRTIVVKDLGGWGATPEEVQLATQLNLLMRSAFDTAGANFTAPEMNIFTGIYPSQNDTLEAALVKIPESLNYIQTRAKIREGLINPAQKMQITLPDMSGGLGGGGLDPQKKARLEELRRKKAAGTLGK